MVKKIFIILISLFTCLILMPQSTEAATDNNIKENLNKSIYLKEVKQIDIKDEDLYILNGTTYLTKYNKIIDFNLIEYVEYDDYLYLLYEKNNKKVFEKYDFLNGGSTYLSFEEKVKGFTVYNNNIYLIGSVDEDAFVYLYDINLNLISKHLYGGTNYEEFNKIYLIDNYIYLIGLKNGISFSSEFKNVGNIDDLKTFIVKLDFDFKIVKDYYINEQSKKEEVSNIYINNKIIYIFLKNNNNNYYQYVLNDNLDLIEKINISKYIFSSDIYLVNSYNINKEKIYLYVKNNSLYYLVFSNKILFERKITSEIDQIVYSKIKDGRLLIYVREQNNILALNYSMYQIERLEDKVVYNMDSSYFDTNHFKVTSYFTDLYFKYDIENDIKFNKTGIYDAQYIAEVSDDYEVVINTKYIVKPFINIINEGIYNAGYKLEFSDEVYLNGKKVYNGEVLNEGNYEVKHIVCGDEFIYNIYVKENFNHDLSINYIYADKVLLKGEKYGYNIKLNSEKIVKKVIVNNKEYEFKQNQNIISLVFNSKNTAMVDEYNIEEIIFIDDTKYVLNKKIIIKTIKELPIINITSDNNKIIYQINDIDKSVMDIVIMCYQNDKIVDIKKSYLNNINVEYLKDYTKIEVILLYEDARNIIYEESLFTISGNIKKDKELFNINFVNDEETIKEVIIDNIDTKNFKINDAYVKDLNIKEVIQEEVDLNFIYIIIISTLSFVMIAIVIYKVKKNAKNKKFT